MDSKDKIERTVFSMSEEVFLEIWFRERNGTSLTVDGIVDLFDDRHGRDNIKRIITIRHFSYYSYDYSKWPEIKRPLIVTDKNRQLFLEGMLETWERIRREILQIDET